jgi:3-phosphoshikimate 1-carboxyvinyltransferase
MQLSGLQGDEKLVSYLSPFGLCIDYIENGCLAYYSSINDVNNVFVQDMENEPDAIPTLVCFCIVKGISFEISGIHTLKNKESDRGLVLQTELSKLNIYLRVDDNIIKYDTSPIIAINEEIILDTYNDHRMAMSFSLLWSIFPTITINNPLCVEKSYPTYWDDLKKLSLDIG